MHFYNEYPDKSSDFLTDMRSISVNNECYTLSAIKAKLHEHILHDSKELDKQIAVTVNDVEKLSLKSTFGWELETSFCEVSCYYSVHDFFGLLLKFPNNAYSYYCHICESLHYYSYLDANTAFRGYS